MDLRYDEYQPIHSTENGLNYGLYYCSICNNDTLHQVVDVDFDNYDVRCSNCGTTAVTRADNFDLYEEESKRCNQEIGAFLADGEEYI